MTASSRTALVVALFVVLTTVMTWPQVLHLATHARDHQDVYFNMWRLGWAAHALATRPLDLFNGNIFFPEPRTLTLSDAMLVESLVASPLLWIGLPPVLVHNLLLLGAIAASAVGAFVLARHLTGSSPAASVAGIVFAYAPYRFEHYMHMELQWAMWSAWALWALHRTFETGSKRMGVLTGFFVALQMMSSVYYGIFLVTLMGLATLLLALASPAARRRPALMPLAIGALVGGLLCTAYATPYLASRRAVGDRSEDEVRVYSATPSSYRVATPENLIYGSRTGRPGRPERRLFPGIFPVLLAVIACVPRGRSKEALVYAFLAVIAFEMSFGLGGFSYRILYDHVPLFAGLRAPARLGIFVLLFLGVLAAYGQRTLLERVPPASRTAIAVLIPSLVLLEYWVAPIALVPFPNTPPPLYAWLATQPKGPIAELPMPQPEALPGQDARYAYMSTFHWKPLVNGYSGYYPPSYLARLEAMRDFPAPASIARLHRDLVRYLIVHESGYPPGQSENVIRDALASGAFAELGRFSDGQGMAAVLVLR